MDAGVSSITREGSNLVVIGDCDPISVVLTVRKVSTKASIILVEAANPQKEKGKQVGELEAPGKEKALAGEGTLGPPQHIYPITTWHNSDEQYPDPCAIM